MPADAARRPADAARDASADAARAWVDARRPQRRCPRAPAGRALAARQTLLKDAREMLFKDARDAPAAR